MDTIVYLEYVKKWEAFGKYACDYSLREHFLEDYRVIRVCIRENIPESMKTGLCRGKKYPNRISGFWNFVFLFGRRLKRSFQTYEQNRKRKLMGKQLGSEVAQMLKPSDEVWVCRDESDAGDMWFNEIFPFAEFTHFMRREWIFRLLPAAFGCHFVVLGNADCLEEVFWKLASQMKSVLWIAPDQLAGEEIEDFAEEFYQETGLAIRLRYLPAHRVYGQMVIPEHEVREPVTILDFTTGKHIVRFYPKKGSVWMDMASEREKERRICARDLSCELISLRKQWKKLPFA